MRKPLFDLPRFTDRVLFHDLSVWIVVRDGEAFRTAWIERSGSDFLVMQQGNEASATRVAGRYQYLSDAEKRLDRIYRQKQKEA